MGVTICQYFVYFSQYSFSYKVGIPVCFFTLSAADLKWPDMIQVTAKQYGVHYTDESHPDVVK